MVFVRENSEGEYAGSGSWLFKNKPNEVVIQDGVFSRTGCERIIRYDYELAKKEHKTLTSISSVNTQNSCSSEQEFCVQADWFGIPLRVSVYFIYEVFF